MGLCRSNVAAVLDSDDALILPVPEAVSATYLVPLATPPDDPVTIGD